MSPWVPHSQVKQPWNDSWEMTDHSWRPVLRVWHSGAQTLARSLDSTSLLQNRYPLAMYITSYRSSYTRGIMINRVFGPCTRSHGRWCSGTWDLARISLRRASSIFWMLVPRDRCCCQRHWKHNGATAHPSTTGHEAVGIAVEV